MVCSQTIYPIPNQLQYGDSFSFTGVKSHAVEVKDYYTSNGLPIKELKNKRLPHEGYTLSITSKKIKLNYATARGKFYAYKTLNQILAAAKEKGQLKELHLIDQPDVAFRGTVEGFYGDPWSHEARIAQLKFYGDWKLNTYIYGPKDDPYHSSPKWREDYPIDEKTKLKQLVEIAKQNQVDFYWAIHPGKDIQWNKQDSLAVLHKFQLMYELGIRHFAVFFDDISGEGTKAEKQAGLLNYLQREFVDRHKDVGALIMCPTEYNKGWSNPKEGTYLDILGEQLDRRIHVMWTGNTVIHDITKEGQLWVNKRLKRPSFVWWNFPVSDYVRNHLLLGSSYGLDKDIQQDMSGFVSNPMDKPEASKVAIFSIANYAWNLKAYDAIATWHQAIQVIAPEVKDAYTLFSLHNADPGPSYHQYRREESGVIGAIVDSLRKSLELHSFGKLNTDDFNQLHKEFTQFEIAAKTIEQHAQNKQLVKEIKPWLDYFTYQGKGALAVLQAYQATDLQERFVAFQALQAAKDRMFQIDQTSNRNPYQPGIVTASRHVLPWIEQAYLYFQKELKDAGFAVKEAANQPVGKVFTNISMLESLPVQQAVQTGNRIFQVLKLGKMLEYIPMEAGHYVGIVIQKGSLIRDVKFRLDKATEGILLEYSEDGHSWDTKKNTKARYLRIINTTKDIQNIKLLDFEIIFE